MTIQLWMRRVSLIAAATTLSSSLLIGHDAQAQGINLASCDGLWFSTSEDFLSRGPQLPGGPIVSDGDLLTFVLGSGTRICVRNEQLLEQFDISRFDHGLDALDQVVIDENLVFAAFSTEIDSVNSAAQFTAGDLLFTNGIVVPNNALLVKFNLPRSLNLGLDAVSIVGTAEEKRDLLAKLSSTDVDQLRQNPDLLIDILDGTNTDILFSTEATPPDVQKPLFLDGDLLSAKMGVIVRSNLDLLPALPAGLPSKGVDYGLDAYTPAVDPIELVPIELLSIEIQAREKTVSDGDALTAGPGIFLRHKDLIANLEPLDIDMGLDALAARIGQVAGCPFRITNVSEIAVGNINPFSGYFDTDRPFGRDVRLQGLLPGRNCPEFSTHEYQVRVSVDNALPVAVLHPATDGWLRDVGPTCNGNDLYETDTNVGWITLADYGRFDECPDDASLAIWRSLQEAPAGAMFAEFRIAMRPIGGGPVVESTPVRIRLDNDKPAPVTMALFQPGTPPIAFTDQCKIDGGGADVIIDIMGEIKDDHFSHYTLTWNGNGNIGGSVPVTVPRTYNSPPRLDGEGTVPLATDVELGTLNLTERWDVELDGILNGDPLPECGFSIRLVAWDRAHNGAMNFGLNSYGLTTANWEDYEQSFCLVP